MTPTEAFDILLKSTNIKVGDTIKILRKAGDKEAGWVICWLPEMDKYIGTQQKVTHIIPGGYGFQFTNKDNGSSYYVPWFIVEKTTPDVIHVPITKTINLRYQNRNSTGKPVFLASSVWPIQITDAESVTLNSVYPVHADDLLAAADEIKRQRKALKKKPTVKKEEEVFTKVG